MKRLFLPILLLLVWTTTTHAAYTVQYHTLLKITYPKELGWEDDTTTYSDPSITYGDGKITHHYEVYVSATYDVAKGVWQERLSSIRVWVLSDKIDEIYWYIVYF